ncbi:MAG: 4-alpha-glucanotransferase [Gemmatimonadota bacterium]|nr:MAG: 4-alpha-glucanotransferase [Gemmatimonadota bacterium]
MTGSPTQTDELSALGSLALALGVHTHYTDGLERPVTVSPETLISICAALGAPIDGPGGAAEALRAFQASKEAEILPPVLVAWDGLLPAITIFEEAPLGAAIGLEDGEVLVLEVSRDASTSEVQAGHPLPPGYHTLTVEFGGRTETCTVISAPQHAWRRAGNGRSWGIGAQLSALRSARSRSLGDLRDLDSLCRWVGSHGGDLVTLLPLLPTFNASPAEPSPYSPVSRLFWSELILDLGGAHRAVERPSTLDVCRADAEVRAALQGRPTPPPASLDAELIRYARFRGAQARLGRKWRAWPSGARGGALGPSEVDADEERFHRVAQTMARNQLTELRRQLAADGVRLGLDLAVGVHPDGYDPWSRQALFVEGMSVGAPPDAGFPSGQDWGFSPVLPEASRREGHRYLAASIAHQAALSGVLRVDHIMALTRLYWIPHGFGLHEGTYVSYPADELFAVLALESQRHRCEVVGENLGTVPAEIDEALPRHRIWGMYLAEFEAMEEDPQPPTPDEVALIGTHDTPTLAGWIAQVDIDERIRCRLLEAAAAPAEREARGEGARRLADMLEGSLEEPEALLAELLEWLGRSPSPLVIPWLEDLWLEVEQVNLPGTRSSERPNWQRPMSRTLDEVMTDPNIDALLRRFDEARKKGPPATDGSSTFR